MRWAEVIMVRSVGSGAKALTSKLQALMKDIERNAGHEDIRIFRREKLDTEAQ